MGLLDDLNKLENTRPRTGGQRCRIAVVMEQMPSDEQKSLEHLIDETEVFGTQIAEVLKNNGYQVSGTHVQHHRRRKTGGGCICPQPGEAE